MPDQHFTDSFWSSDYAGGLGVLFQKLQQGVMENQQIVTLASMRADAEDAYAQTLADIAPTVDRMTGGFSRDDGASVRKAYEGVRGEMVEATKSHKKIASNIRELVVNPFSRWCDAHALRIQNSQDELQSKIKSHDRQAELVKRLRSQYFNKCRLVEDLEEETKMAFKEPETTSSPKPSSPPPRIVVEDDSDEPPVEIGEESYRPDQLKALFNHMLGVVPIGELKLPILGTYQNVSAGSDIVEYIQKHMRASSIAYAEKIGQDLVDRGFLRLVGNVGSTFANSSRMKYQWRPRVFQVSGVPEKRRPPSRAGTQASMDGTPESPSLGNIADTISAWNPLNNSHPNETAPDRLKREAKEADDKYKAAVRRLDMLRCNLEETMMDHLRFLERCETDRLKAIKSVILDLSGAISNSLPSLQSQVDHMMLYQETIQPLGDLRYLLENYRTGGFIPKVVPYENYYGSVDDQTFGVDLEARARADRKRVPGIITSILTHLDHHYPDLEGDEARRKVWIVDVSLAATHHLRNTINNGQPVSREVLDNYELPIIASVLKLYLLELPDSLVSSQVYDIIKTIYNTTNDAGPNPISTEAPDASPRIKVLQSTLGQLRLNNIATLDAIMTHFTRLIDLTSADENYVTALAQSLAPCILRPRMETSVTLEERHSYRLIRDLFDHKEAIFGELKRTLSSSSSAATAAAAARQRAHSNTGEENRRANMEARAKAITEQRQREKSPAPMNRHRRDKSTDGSIGRFPVVASPRPDHMRSVSGVALQKRGSLEVPGSNESSPVQARSAPRIETGTTGTNATTNGSQEPRIAPSNGYTDPQSAGSISMPGAFTGGGPGPHIPPPLDDDSVASESIKSPISVKDHEGLIKTASLKRSTIGSGGRRGQRDGHSSMLSRDSLGGMNQMSETTPTPPEKSPQGVELVDRAMDDFS